MRTTALPHSEETERAILACILLSPHLIDAARGLLTAEAFYLERHRALWSAMVRIDRAGEEIDLRSVQAALESAGTFEKAGGFAFLAGLDLDLPLGGLERMDQYCRRLLDYWAKRRLYAAAAQLSEAALNGHETEHIIAETAAEIDRIARDRSGPSGAVLMADMFDDFNPDAGPQDPGISTGLADLDALIGGYRKGQLVVVAARPAMGKTSYAVQLAVCAARAGLRSRMHSLEMTAEEIRDVMIAQLSGVPARQIRTRQMVESEKRRAVEASVELGSLGELMSVDPTPAMTPGQIWAAASLAKMRTGLDLLIIDSLGLMRYVGPERDHRLKIGAITSEAKEQAKRLDVPVILLHHLSRMHESEKRAPRMRDLADAASIERDADVIIFPYRPGDYLDEDDPERERWIGRALFLVEKNRGGETGAVPVAWTAPRQLFGNVSSRKELRF